MRKIRAKVAVVHSARAARACAVFGVEYPPPPPPGWCASTCFSLAQAIDSQVTDGQIALISGPSGCGKSTLLRSIASLSKQAGGLHVDSTRIESLDKMHRSDIDAPLVDLFTLELDDAIRLLTRLGLGEPRLLASPLRALSEGQRHRAMVAMALARSAERRRRSPVTLTIDEFGSVLDRLGAGLLARAIRRVIQPSNDGHKPRARPRLIVATAHEDLRSSLRPDVHIRLSLAGLQHTVISLADSHSGERTVLSTRLGGKGAT